MPGGVSPCACILSAPMVNLRPNSRIKPLSHKILSAVDLWLDLGPKVNRPDVRRGRERPWAGASRTAPRRTAVIAARVALARFAIGSLGPDPGEPGGDGTCLNPPALRVEDRLLAGRQEVEAGRIELVPRVADARLAATHGCDAARTWRTLAISTHLTGCPWAVRRAWGRRSPPPSDLPWTACPPSRSVPSADHVPGGTASSRPPTPPARAAGVRIACRDSRGRCEPARGVDRHRGAPDEVEEASEEASPRAPSHRGRADHPVGPLPPGK